MCTEITLQAVDSVDGDVVVCHIDEFDSEEIGLVARLADAETKSARVDRATADRIARCDYVKHTDYYRITVHRSSDTRE